MEEKYLCLKCGESLMIPIDKLQTENDVIRVTCNGCDTDFIMGLQYDDENELCAYTYKLFDGKEIGKVLNRLLYKVEGLPFLAIDSMLASSRLGRWNDFQVMVKRFYNVISMNEPLSSYLMINKLLVK